MKIFVGSTNPVKINAVTISASEKWPELEVKGVAVDSGVSEQPLTDQETEQGATTRAKKALKTGLLRVQRQGQNELDLEQAVLGVGVEGGVYTENDQLWCTVWAAVCSQPGKIFTCNGARFKIPQVIATRIKQGEEMGPIIDDLVGGENIKQQGGMISVVTREFIDRTEQYVGVVKLAIGLWYGQNWQDQIL